MAEWNVVAVSRTPASAAAPTLEELERIVFDNLAWHRELSKPDTIQLGCAVDRLPDVIKSRLRDLRSNPTELRIYRDGSLVAAGPLLGGQIQGASLTLYARGLLAYLRFMYVETDLSYTATDQFTIAVGLVDHYQGLAYGNYGIVTSGVGTSGVTRDRSYPRAELVNIADAVEQLGQVDNGFDVDVNPSTRALVLSHPSKGSDVTAGVVLDGRNITAADIVFSVAPADVASEGYATGKSLWSQVSDTATRAAWGRAGVAQSFHGVTQQATLDGHAQALLDGRTAAWLVPGSGLIPVDDVDVGDFDVGDTVEYSFDAGLGVQTGDFRVTRRQVRIDARGTEQLGVEFA